MPAVMLLRPSLAPHPLTFGPSHWGLELAVAPPVPWVSRPSSPPSPGVTRVLPSQPHWPVSLHQAPALEGTPKHRASQAPPDQRLCVPSLAPGQMQAPQGALGVLPHRSPTRPPLLHTCHGFPSPRGAPVGCAPLLPWPRRNATTCSPGWVTVPKPHPSSVHPHGASPWDQPAHAPHPGAAEAPLSQSAPGGRPQLWARQHGGRCSRPGSA